MRCIQLLAAIALAASPLLAQTSTHTTCQSYGTTNVSCQSETSPSLSAQTEAEQQRLVRATQDTWYTFFAALQARREREMNIAATQQFASQLAAEREAALIAARRITDRANERDLSARLAEDERAKAQFALFSKRAEFIRKQTVTRIPLMGIPALNYWNESGDLLAILFIADHLAPNAAIKEALEPLDANYAAASTSFMNKFRDAVIAAAVEYHIPRRDFERFQQEAWANVLRLFESDLNTSSLVIRESVYLVGRDFEISKAAKPPLRPSTKN